MSKIEWELVDRPIAITDVETTGLDPAKHEIIEIGLVLVNLQSLTIIDTLDVKIKPTHIETASAKALEVNGYNEAGWQEAISLEKAIDVYIEKTREAMFCAHNMVFDWSFLVAAFKQLDKRNLMDYHRLDLLTMAWLKLRTKLRKFNLNEIANFLGVEPESMPHRAINGAMTEYQVLKKLLEL